MRRLGLTSSNYQWPDDEKSRVGLSRYLEAVSDAGAQGEPLWLPPDEESASEIAARTNHLAATLDGLILSGGKDLPPAMYGEEPRGDAHLQFVPPARPVFEAALLREFLERGKPVLGICYGCQFANVWRAGSLIQDIPTQLPDAIAHGDARHAVHVAPDTLLHGTLGLEGCDIQSFHHQSIARVAPDARVTAVASDGVIEAIEFSGAPFFVGVQWHPEYDRAAVATQRLFSALVKSAGG